ncbi:hypothetical protein ACFOOP_03595 [Marinicaulis aureus]|uniref:Uncharacterized protein n=1 Tax=Hyphococcus aureus TaxID=2666033 RepID=A0ABW1KXK7_9PROT
MKSYDPSIETEDPRSNAAFHTVQMHKTQSRKGNLHVLTPI